MIPFLWVPRMVGTGLRIPVESTKASVVHVGRSAMDVIPTNQIRPDRNTCCVKELLEVSDGREVKMREYLIHTSFVDALVQSARRGVHTFTACARVAIAPGLVDIHGEIRFCVVIPR